MIRTALFLLSFTACCASAAEKPIQVPSDPSAKFVVLEVGGDYPNRTIVTKRSGSSGTSYSKRLYDCKAETVKYLGTGDSLEAMAASKPDPKMTPIFPNSIAWYVALEACMQ